MEFCEKLNEYIELLDCSGKELAENSHLSPATISRYRSGERVPEVNTDNFKSLIEGIVKIAKDKNISEITKKSVIDDFIELAKNNNINITRLQDNLSALLTIMAISISELSKYLNYDASYISRIRNGQRQPSNPEEFAMGIAKFIVYRYKEDSEKKSLADLIGCKLSDIKEEKEYYNCIVNWLVQEKEDDNKNCLISFLEKLDEFDLDEYIRAIHFDKLKVPSALFQLPTSKSYFGLKEMMDSELAFLKATIFSKSKESVIMYSDMPMGEMAKDPEFPKKWMFGMALMLKKGLHLNQIHNLDRSFEDMMLGLEAWIPMYMTGQISPYYLKEIQNNVFSHFLKVSGTVALSGEAITGYHSEGKYYLTKNKDEVSYYKKRAKQLLSKALSLMKIYKKDSENSFNAFLNADIDISGNRRSILSSLPLYTAKDELINKILKENNISIEDQSKIKKYVDRQRKMTEKILKNNIIIEEIPIIEELEFKKNPITLSLSGMFYEKDIFYNFKNYKEHLEDIVEYEKQHPNYIVKQNSMFAFRNIQILMHEGKWVILSKNKTPAIHFVIQHPKMIRAFENMVIQVRD